jgi:hypothetical protein
VIKYGKASKKLLFCDILSTNGFFFQDQRIQEITQANIYLQQELASAKQQLEDMTSNVQALQDQNSLLR